MCFRKAKRSWKTKKKIDGPYEYTIDPMGIGHYYEKWIVLRSIISNFGISGVEYSSAVERVFIC
jgi:hypothetical protein